MRLTIFWLLLFSIPFGCHEIDNPKSIPDSQFFDNSKLKPIKLHYIEGRTGEKIEIFAYPIPIGPQGGLEFQKVTDSVLNLDKNTGQLESRDVCFCDLNYLGWNGAYHRFNLRNLDGPTTMFFYLFDDSFYWGYVAYKVEFPQLSCFGVTLSMDFSSYACPNMTAMGWAINEIGPPYTYPWLNCGSNNFTYLGPFSSNCP